MYAFFSTTNLLLTNLWLHSSTYWYFN